MNINMYVINAILILMVIRQVREHPLDLRSLAVPVLAVGCAAVLFLHSVPGRGNDIALELACVLAGAAMGAIGGLATRLRLGADGRPLGRTGWLAASMWVGGVGASRLRGGREQRSRAGGRPIQHRAPHHRFGGLGGGARHDGDGRRAHPAGRHLPAWSPAGGRAGRRYGPHPGGFQCLSWHPRPVRVTLCP
jgi:hypothetical protein